VTRRARVARRASIGIRVEPAVKEALGQAAAADHRTMSALVEMLIIRHLRETGFLPPARRLSA
jgi:hypothetical protein